MHAYNLLKNMQKKGALERVRPNLYVRIPAQIVHDKGKYVEDPILVGKHLVKPYFFSYYTALNLHGLAQQYSRYFYISTTKHMKEINYHENVFHPVILKEERFFGFRKIKYRGEDIFVSDLEKTILDVMGRPEYSGGFEEVFRCLLGLERPDWDRLLKYLEKTGEKILYNRVGFVFDLLRDAVNTPESFLRKLQKKLCGNIYYFENGKSGKFHRKWNIIVDPRLENIIKGV
ncbi:MAG: hypothetical protein ACE5L7_09020 [Candidatus Aminicenantales bacterium]